MNAAPTGAATHEDLRLQSLHLNLREHNIGFYLPPGAHIEGRARLPHGALIAGTFVGELLVEQGSLIIVGSGQLQGTAEADRVYIEGTVSSPATLDPSSRAAPEPSAQSDRSVIIGRLLFAASSDARIDADIYAPNVTATRAKLWGRVHSLDEVERRPLGGEPEALGHRHTSAGQPLPTAPSGLQCEPVHKTPELLERPTLAARAAAAALHTLSTRGRRR